MSAVGWETRDGVVELALGLPPCNEIGTAMLAGLERFVAEALGEARAVVIHSTRPAGFSAGADLRELHRGMLGLAPDARRDGVRDFLGRIHAVLNALDQAPIPVVAAVHGVVFGGGFELALACDLIVADRTARFAFPELRLGLIPGFGGLPRLQRDVSNAVVRDLLLTGRSINATRAHAVGIAAQLAAEGHALAAARAAAAQALKFDAATVAAAKRFAKPFPAAALAEEIELFLQLFERPAVEAALRKFVEDDGPLPYLP